MNRRNFFSRISKAALAFSVAPGIFKAFPAQRRVEAAVTHQKVVPFWFQTSRRTRCVDKAYADFITQLALGNGRKVTGYCEWTDERREFLKKLAGVNPKCGEFLRA